MTDGDGLRCAYHGWLYDTAGTCVETPAEPATSRLKDRIHIAGYPVQEMGGLVWAYLGPQPAPLLPRLEHLLAEGWNRSTGFTSIPCNWLQIAENTLDPLHVEQLHMKYTNWVRAQTGEARCFFRIIPIGCSISSACRSTTRRRSFFAQDMMVWITQGPITDHGLEHLGESDRGVALYRKTLLEQVARVERGEDPLGVIRDPAEQTPYVRMPVERHVGYDLGEVNSRSVAFSGR